MGTECRPGRPSDDQLDIMCHALRAQFGDRAIMVVERQSGSASGEAMATWSRILLRLRG